ncbi:NnrS family protein [Brackiella oedipodis]|uniref:NnrS family protein n=1 Tax=Brackiella oedipodis TaxID=124225 RepID=UPI000A001E21|nr:NnrS family protein [Brackiella oedipodis]
MLIQIEPPSAKAVKPGPNWEAFLSLGFRPLYLGGTAWAIVAVALWVFAPHLLQGPLNGVWWHVHEVFWGFVATIACAFLLTASATWTGINPAKNQRLALLCIFWLAARLLFLVPGQWALVLGGLADVAFYLGSALCLGRVIFKAKSSRNYVLPFAVAAMGLSNGAYIACIYGQHYEFLMAIFDIGLLFMVMVVLLIARRVIPFFASRAAALQIPMHATSGQYQLWACAFTILMALLQQQTGMALGLAVAGVIGLVQLFQWQPHKILKHPLLWVLYISYFFFALGLISAALHFMGWELPELARPAFFVHILGAGGMAVMIIGMVTRTALGHTGHPLKADKYMVCCYVLIIVAALARVAALYPSVATLPLLHIATTCWVLGFGLYIIRFAPILVRHRADHPGMRRFNAQKVTRT